MPVIERSVTIAGISTRELVIKDYALEANEDKMRKAAHLMAQNLAGNLAMVTCKEPLRTNMANNLRLTLGDQGFGEVRMLAFSSSKPPANTRLQSISDNVIQTIVNDNINYACAAIEKAAMERAVAEVDESFTVAYEQRRTHREVSTAMDASDISLLTVACRIVRASHSGTRTRNCLRSRARSQTS